MATKREELATNATRWATVAKRDVPYDTGFIFIFFPKAEIGEGRGVVVSNVKDRAIIDELKSILKKHGEVPRIVIPGGD